MQRYFAAGVRKDNAIEFPGGAATPRTFAGYRRPGRRGVGTRNTIVILGTTSHTASFARQLTARDDPGAHLHTHEEER